MGSITSSSSKLILCTSSFEQKIYGTGNGYGWEERVFETGNGSSFNGDRGLNVFDGLGVDGF